MVLDNEFNQVAVRKDRNGKAVQVIKFSPDDKVCATGAHDQYILTYNVENNFKPMHRIKGHSSTVKFIDFTLDSSAF
jgi:microtubule-associated protein-like 6